MSECKSYLAILIESLEQKKLILTALIRKNEEQAHIIQEEDMDVDAFTKNTDEKATLIEKLELLDNGFSSIYDKIADELVTNKALYTEEIKTLQTYISEITEMSVTIQASEQRNKQMIENYFSNARQKIRQSKMSVKTASNYYKNMSRVDYTDSQLWDKKK